jgi:hypothetical protein
LVERLVRNEKVWGSTPHGSTSLRSPLRSELRLGKPEKREIQFRSAAENEHCRAEVRRGRRRAAIATEPRLLYFFHGRQVAILAHSLTKEDEIPNTDIERAIKREKLFEANPKAHIY